MCKYSIPKRHLEYNSDINPSFYHGFFHRNGFRTPEGPGDAPLLRAVPAGDPVRPEQGEDQAGERLGVVFGQKNRPNMGKSPKSPEEKTDFTVKNGGRFGISP